MTRWEEFNTIIDNETLSTHEKILLITIFRYINKESGFCYGSTESLTAKSRIGNQNTFSKARHGLVMKGLIQYNLGRGKGTIYQLPLKSEYSELNTLCTEVSNEIVQKCMIKRNKKENRTEMNYYNQANVAKLNYE